MNRAVERLTPRPCLFLERRDDHGVSVLKKEPQDLHPDGIRRRLTAKQREEIAIYYYSHNVTQKLLADKYGISQSTVYGIVNNLKLMKKAKDFLDKELDKATIRKKVAALKAIEAAPDAMDQLIKIMGQNVEDVPLQFQYVVQNASTAILDRAGVKPEADSNANDIVVRFADPEGIFKPGMPDLESGAVETSATEEQPAVETGSSDS